MDSSPVEIDDAALKLPQFELEDIENVSCEESYKTGSLWKQKYVHIFNFKSLCFVTNFIRCVNAITPFAIYCTNTSHVTW